MNTVQQLLEQLIEQGWTEAAIADRLGVNQVTIYRWRRGNRRPPLEKLVVTELTRMLRRKKDLARAS
ncbi:MAG TPA: helix-turn-helix transcriptional regulator [Dehalococcoidia bacterium]|jgi:transcriptional regulator with XRE-family HTH domain|nr:helix-turn-helix transcriptional regulator [Dehalococcoidia bacterium]